VEKKRMAFVLAALVALVTIAGCGGGASSNGDSTSSGAGPALAKAQFVKKANQICRTAEKKRGVMIKAAIEAVPTGSKLSVAEQEELVIQALTPYDRMAQELSDLGAPNGDEAKVARIVSAFEAAFERAKREPKSAINGAAFQTTNKLASKYGLASCVI
jgi:hypothetical protein